MEARIKMREPQEQPAALTSPTTWMGKSSAVWEAGPSEMGKLGRRCLQDLPGSLGKILLGSGSRASHVACGSGARGRIYGTDRPPPNSTVGQWTCSVELCTSRGTDRWVGCRPPHSRTCVTNCHPVAAPQLLHTRGLAHAHFSVRSCAEPARE